MRRDEIRGLLERGWGTFVIASSCDYYIKDIVKKDVLIRQKYMSIDRLPIHINGGNSFSPGIFQASPYQPATIAMNDHRPHHLL